MNEWWEDKFGRPMYPRTRLAVWRCGRELERMGFRQASWKPWLFVRQTPLGPVFANMGGTGVVPIWEEPLPMIHHQLRGENWRVRKVLRQMHDELDAAEVPYRYSFYQTSEPGGLWFPIPGEEPVDTADNFSGPDGYCHHCGTELLVGELLCDDCTLLPDAPGRFTCEACRDGFPAEAMVVHHVRYAPPVRTVRVCRSCHLLIHRTNQFPDLKPDHSPATRVPREAART